MTWSWRESRWKHMVTTSFSAAPLQMGSDCDRQKARLHWLQEPVVWVWRAAARGMMGSRAGSSSRASRRERGSSSVPAEGAGVESGEGVSSVLLSSSSPSFEVSGSFAWVPGIVLDLDLISIMVLLVKQVHLQNVGGAGVGCQYQGDIMRELPKQENSQAAATMEAKAPRSKMNMLRRFILSWMLRT